MEWKKLAGKVVAAGPLAKKFLVFFILKAVGVTGGFWAWLVGLFVSKELKVIGKEIEKAAELADAKKIDEDNAKKYKEDLAKGATDEQKISDELDILNGGKP